ncbi:MAG TPA: DoxX family membrane protein [Anaerolineales bacterium]|nr:DoxX family membrane protein [Anaerolineales bacterium]
MSDFSKRFDQVDKRLTHWMSRYGIGFLRISLGIVYLWFGVLKFFPGLSPAEQLAVQTMERLSFGLVGGEFALNVLAVWETAIGLGLLLGVWLRFTLLLLFLQWIGTIMPLLLYPQVAFTRFPFVPTLEGQYIIKNLVLISAALVIGATVRGGGLVDEPGIKKLADQVVEVGGNTLKFDKSGKDR